MEEAQIRLFSDKKKSLRLAAKVRAAENTRRFEEEEEEEEDDDDGGGDGGSNGDGVWNQRGATTLETPSSL
ncbi:uncharacterized protein G2W53_006647 [Senna tora]|uniref:Uncharacterized protein n=1 Tax=Senna tora TaxID=362788 RepID=A0A834X5F9_9FABA|nr:uncharacterized protein G2W53_006647 [Senna tora]